ncbi:MAG: HNH endonuclease [Candidatus Aminicenantes bacterium]|nr:HNH endonuclease [Candidatus Aminicenantes bacterium]NIM80057.1 HNH endonuclease [Candidatus Aminicenantes bacterium]NIN19400.1 HNH endonuclease [Candidatus Aminicenantes bacterium]NIN43299.1 HNH endonuclease [Candidatus Aminicenantes bacterium]NIN86043.1 HNH endonuclease [Candidatus Aminicenantes bacterium]
MSKINQSFVDNGMKVKLPESKTLNISAFEQMLSLKNLTNSYKLYWFAAVFDEIRKGNVEITFGNIVLMMITRSWYSIAAYRLNLGFMDKLNDLVSYIYERYQLAKDISRHDLFSFLEDLDDREFETRLTDFYKYVPFRLISPFYPEIKGFKDQLKNRKIEELSKSNDEAIYQIYSPEKKIIINNNWFDYIYKNQVIISGWYYYKLIFFLQKRNPSIPAIPYKLEAPKKRYLKNAKIFWSKIIKFSPLIDICTNQPISSDNLSIDHFIPWSFVLHDQLWNLVPTFQAINSSKSDGLPQLELYLDKFCNLQYYAFITALEKKFPMRLVEDYIEIARDIIFSKNIRSDIFVRNLKENIIPLYQLARNQGFPVWEYPGC